MQKRDDFIYANGPSYCISEALMMKVERYLRYIIILLFTIVNINFKDSYSCNNNVINGKASSRSVIVHVHVVHMHRGKNFDKNCKKAAVVMDDILPGVIINGVLGVNLTDIPEFRSQLNSKILISKNTKKKTAEVTSCVTQSLYLIQHA